MFRNKFRCMTCDYNARTQKMVAKHITDRHPGVSPQAWAPITPLLSFKIFEYLQMKQKQLEYLAKRKATPVNIEKAKWLKTTYSDVITDFKKEGYTEGFIKDTLDTCFKQGMFFQKRDGEICLI